MFKIDQEFKKLIPPLAKDERQQLEANILADGCREPLTVWQEENVLLDGHNRFDICTRGEIECGVNRISLPSRQAAVNWIINNQLGRRNVTPEQASYLRGKRYNSEKAQGQRTDLTLDQNDLKLPTAQRLADEFKVSEPTIKRDGKFAESVDTIADRLGESARNAILAGDSKIPKKDIVDAAEYLKNSESPALSGAEDSTLLVARSEEEIIKAAREIQRAKQADKKALIEQKKQEAMAVEAATIDDAPSVYLADAIEFLHDHKDDHFDLLLTDPPYMTDVDDIESFAAEWVPVALAKLKQTGRAYICTGAYPEEMKAYLDVFLSQDKFFVDCPIIWTYRNTLGVTPKMKYNLNYQIVWHLYSNISRELDTSVTNEMFSVQDINAPDGRQFNRFHAWQKPNELARRIIAHATQPGDLVVDPFTCTGTFVLMSAKMGRQAIGSDISVDNLKIAEERGCRVVY